MRLQPYEVVLVPFPYADRMSDKRRPALVVSDALVAERLGRVWLAMITSAPAGEFGDHAIADIASAGLPVASTLRASKIATIDSDRVLRVIGRFAPADQQAARAVLSACAAFA